MKKVKFEKVQHEDKKKTKKLKKTADNQKRHNREEVKEEEPNIFFPHSTTSIINPMLMDDIVAHVFEFLDLETLKTIRSVSQLWRKEGGKEMLRKSYIRVPPIFQIAEKEGKDEVKDEILNKKRKKYVNALTRLISTFGTFQQVAIHISKEKNFLDESTILFKESIGLQEKCGELKYTKNDSIGLFTILSKLPHVSKLITHDLNAPPVISTPSDKEFWTEDKLQSFRDKLKALKEIKYHLVLTPASLANFTTKCLDEHGELNITGLKVTGRKSNEPAPKELLTSFITIIINNPNAHKNWKLKELDIDVDTTLPVELYHSFFQSLMSSSSSSVPTLKKLRVNVCGAWDKVKNLTPWETKWHLPIASKLEHSSPSPSSTLSPLDRLTFLSVECPANKLWPVFTIALQLPCLKTLIIKSDKEAGYKFDRKVKEWNEDGNGIHRLESKSLEVVDLTNCPFFHLRTVDHSCWPNLKCLRIQLQQYQVLPPFGLSPIFKDLSKIQSLERLEFILTPDKNHGKVGYWDALFCGKMRSYGDDHSGEFSLAKLKHLKSLSLDSRCEPAHDVSDFFIQHALVHLKSLQGLVIHGHKFKKSAQIQLRQALGPYAAIQIYK